MPTLTASHHLHHHGARRIAAFVALSLLIHGALFFTLTWRQREEMPRAEAAHAPISVRLLQAAPETRPAPETPPPVASAAPPPKPAAKTVKPAKPRSAPKIARSARPHPRLA
ncbi:MAG: hypothetical protein ACM3WS_00165, partial [Bacillota bacterium]